MLLTLQQMNLLVEMSLIYYYSFLVFPEQHNQLYLGVRRKKDIYIYGIDFKERSLEEKQPTPKKKKEKEEREEKRIHVAEQKERINILLFLFFFFAFVSCFLLYYASFHFKDATRGIKK